MTPDGKKLEPIPAMKAADLGLREFACQAGKGDPPMDCIHPDCPCGSLTYLPDIWWRLSGRPTPAAPAGRENSMCSPSGLGGPAKGPSDVWRTDMENAPRDGGVVFVARRANGHMFFADDMLGNDRARDISTGVWCELAAWTPLPPPASEGVEAGPPSTEGASTPPLSPATREEVRREGLTLHQVAQRLMSLASKIERASSEAEENELCDERDRLLGIIRRADAALSPTPREEEGQ